MTAPMTGIGLEARVQRLFLAQGLFSERGLIPAITQDRRMVATDIDVLVSEYSNGFHLTRRHVEVKGGKNVSVIDRIIWMSGIRTLLHTDASYLVLDSFDEEASSFARSLTIDVMTLLQLSKSEQAISIPEEIWPCRSNFRVLEPLKQEWRREYKPRSAQKHWRFIRECLLFVEVEAWREFTYGSLNRLMRLMQDLSSQLRDGVGNQAWVLAARYAASAMLVRLAQHLMAVSYDVTRVPLTDLEEYLGSRLAFGDQDPKRAVSLIESTVEWTRQSMAIGDGDRIPRPDLRRLTTPPGYARDFIALVRRIMDSSDDARSLVVAVETSQFSTSTLEGFPRLRSVSAAGEELAGLMKGFCVAALKVDKSLLEPWVPPSVYNLSESLSEQGKLTGLEDGGS